MLFSMEEASLQKRDNQNDAARATVISDIYREAKDPSIALKKLAFYFSTFPDDAERKRVITTPLIKRYIFKLLQKLIQGSLSVATIHQDFMLIKKTILGWISPLTQDLMLSCFTEGLQDPGAIIKISPPVGFKKQDFFYLSDRALETFLKALRSNNTLRFLRSPTINCIFEEIEAKKKYVENREKQRKLLAEFKQVRDALNAVTERQEKLCALLLKWSDFFSVADRGRKACCNAAELIKKDFYIQPSDRDLFRKDYFTLRIGNITALHMTDFTLLITNYLAKVKIAVNIAIRSFDDYVVGRVEGYGKQRLEDYQRQRKEWEPKKKEIEHLAEDYFLSLTQGIPFILKLNELSLMLRAQEWVMNQCYNHYQNLKNNFMDLDEKRYAHFEEVKKKLDDNSLKTPTKEISSAIAVTNNQVERMSSHRVEAPLCAHAIKKVYRCLAINGEGIYALMNAALLMKLEEQTACRIYELFDCVVGTSWGGIVALAVVASRDGSAPLLTTRKILDLFYKHGKKIFSKKSGQLHDSKTLQAVLSAYFKNAYLSDALVRVLIPYTILSAENTKLIQKDGLVFDSYAAKRLEMEDFAMSFVAAASATHLPSCQSAQFLDGEQRYAEDTLYKNNAVEFLKDKILEHLFNTQQEIIVLNLSSGVGNQTGQMARTHKSLRERFGGAYCRLEPSLDLSSINPNDFRPDLLEKYMKILGSTIQENIAFINKLVAASKQNRILSVGD